MTSESDSSTATGLLAGGGSKPSLPDRFGSDMARRVRPRTGRLRRHADHHFVGAVGRSCVGFGRAVGRSGTVRPTVDARNLDTLSLRPPRGWWHASDTDGEQPSVPGGSTQQVETATGRRTTDARRMSTWTNRLLPDPTAHGNPARRSKPTPAAGATSNHDVTAVATPAPRFVPSGDARFDALRRAVAAGLTPDVISRGPEAVAAVLGRQAASAQPEPAVSATRSRPLTDDSTPPTAGPRTDADSAAPVHAEASDARRGDTAAGRDTGPGGLGRRVRPEAADPEQVARRKGASPAERSGRRVAVAPPRGDRTRPAPPSAPHPGGRGVGATRPDTGSAPARRTSAPARQSRSRPAPSDPHVATARTSATPPASPPSPTAPFRVTDPTSSTSASPAGIADTRFERVARTAADEATPSRPPSIGPTPGPGSAVAPEPLPRSIGDPRREFAAAGAVAVVDPPVEPPADLPVQRPNLRMQRMIAAGHTLATIEGSDAADATVSGASRQLTVAAPASRVLSEPLASSDPARQHSAPAPAVATRHRRRPELPGPDHGRHGLIRRVTIPRVMSAAHHPDSLLPSPPRRSPASGPRPEFRPADGFTLRRRAPDLRGDEQQTRHHSPVPSSTRSSMQSPGPSSVQSTDAMPFLRSGTLARLRRAVDENLGVSDGRDRPDERTLGAPATPASPDPARPARLPSAIVRRQPSSEAPAATVDDPDGAVHRSSESGHRAVDARPVGHDHVSPDRSVTVRRRLVMGQPQTLTTGRPDDAQRRDIQQQPIRRSSRRSNEPSAVADGANLPDIARVSVAPPSGLRGREHAADVATTSIVEPAAVDGGGAGAPSYRARSRPRELQRQRVNHLTNEWSLVKGSWGALNQAVKAPLRRSMAGATAAESSANEATPVADPSDRSPLDTRAGSDQTPPAGPDLAERFMTELSRSARHRPAPLPTTFQPMADQITGGRKVLLATDTATRRALRSVGKVAATTDDTIHLDTAATSAARLHHVVAHELTHVANPSPVARFFDDVIDSPEERQAEATAKIMTKSPLTPTASILSAPGRVARRTAMSDASIAIRRSVGAPSNASSSPPSSPGTVSAEALAASITGRAAPSASDQAVRRVWEPATPTVARPASGPQAGSQRQETPAPVRATPAFDPDSDEAKAWFAEQLEKNADAIVRILGDRLVTDLERRGGRMWGGI